MLQQYIYTIYRLGCVHHPIVYPVSLAIVYMCAPTLYINAHHYAFNTMHFYIHMSHMSILLQRGCVQSFCQPLNQGLSVTHASPPPEGVVCNHCESPFIGVSVYPHACPLLKRVACSFYAIPQSRLM